MQLIYLAPVSWSSFAQRPHKFVSWFQSITGGDVLWIDPYPTRFPSRSDFRRLGSQKSNENNTCPPWISIIRHSALPVEPLPASAFLNVFIWRSVLKKIDTFSSQKRTLLAIGKPSVLALTVLKRLNGIRSIYDAMDDFSAFYTGFSRSAMSWREKKIVHKVNCILASSTALKKRWSAVRADVKLVHNGMDAEVLPTPKNSIGVREKKILGYVGTIGHWFDWDWVVTLANTQPMDVVRLIGPVFAPIPCNLPLNIELLPPCSQKEALRLMQEFSVGLIPFKLTKLTASVDPIKYYEYRALGLPVISTNFGEMALRDGQAGVFLTNKHSDLTNLVSEAMAVEYDVDKIQNFRTANSWKARFDSSGIFP